MRTVVIEEKSNFVRHCTEQEMVEEHCVVEEATSVGKGLSSLEKSVGANTIWVDAPPRSALREVLRSCAAAALRSPLLSALPRLCCFASVVPSHRARVVGKRPAVGLFTLR